MTFSPRTAEVLVPLAYKVPRPAALSSVPEPVLWVSLFVFHQAMMNPQTAPQWSNSGNLQTQEASAGAVHHAGDALRQWTYDELHARLLTFWSSFDGLLKPGSADQISVSAQC